MAIIEVEHLMRRFGNLHAVTGVSFEIGEGEVFGFLGPNGAGKTTTIDMLCTLLRPTGGRATVNGFDVVGERNDVRRSIGLVFQQSTPDASLSAEQNLRFHARAYGVPADLREQRVRELLTLVELWHRRKESTRTFSGGMKRRLEIVRGLMHRPRILFLDEPTLGLDPQTRRRVWEYLAELRDRENLTIFLTTHYMDEADNCDRIAIIDHGQIVSLDTPSNLKSSLGGDLITLSTPDGRAVAEELRDLYGISPEFAGGSVSFQVAAGEAFLPEFVRTFSHPLDTIGLRRPTLDDVFLHLTGHEIRGHDHGEGELATAEAGTG